MQQHTEKTEQENWGARVLETISNDLQNSLPGLRGFSITNLKNMKQFFETYSQFVISQSVTGELQNTSKKAFSQSSTGEFVSMIPKGSKNSVFKNEHNFIIFLSISYTHHVSILNKTKSLEEKIFYIKKTAENQWTVSILEYQIERNYFKKQGKLSHNFKTTLPKALNEKAIFAFKDELLLDFINIQDPDNPNEREIEEGIIKNLFYH